ncbi:hypothetical protein K443DRAFT_125773 [Laccaria amethystina LaAM-08-1]|uniref:Unplaced genomic scaffold K443scaffold_339, whole genome shotgun sequence n=1 Tax=Laccaria amethystina LaAM-08-1 TaxID=1095629 RepID=A0A0C9WW10_9AGAR|nr:hypothetical protein K443DRAFT_125773 [Laccaria amethystina LaAM-08-1]
MPSKKLTDAERLAALEAENRRLKRQQARGARVLEKPQLAPTENLIQKPQGRAGREYSTRIEVGLSRNRWNRHLRIIRTIAQKYFESGVTLSKQRKPVVEKVVLLIQAEINFYHQFQDGWPIRDILARYLSNKSSRNNQDIEAERKDAKADSRKRRRDAYENSSDDEEGDGQEDQEDSAGEDELQKGYDTDHEDLAKGKRKRKGSSPSGGKRQRVVESQKKINKSLPQPARIRDTEPAKKKSNKPAVELMSLKKSSVPTKRAKQNKAKKNIIVSDSEDGEQRFFEDVIFEDALEPRSPQRRSSVSSAGENSPRRRRDLVHAKGKAGSWQDLTAIDHTDDLATCSKICQGKNIRAFSELTNADDISTFRDNLSLINQCPVVGCHEDMPVEPSDALIDLLHTYNELRYISEPFDDGEHLTEVKDAICTEIHAGNVKMDARDQGWPSVIDFLDLRSRVLLLIKTHLHRFVGNRKQIISSLAWTEFREKVPDIDAFRCDLSIQKRVAYLKNVGYFGGMGEFVIINTLTAACRIYRPELFAPLAPQEFLDFIVVPHVATFLMAQDYHDSDIDKPHLLGCYRRFHKVREAKRKYISLKSPSPSNAKAQVPSISATSPHRSEEIGHAPEEGPNERHARCQPALEHMDCDPVVPPKIRDKKQRPRQIETLKLSPLPAPKDEPTRTLRSKTRSKVV